MSLVTRGFGGFGQPTTTVFAGDGSVIVVEINDNIIQSEIKTKVINVGVDNHVLSSSTDDVIIEGTDNVPIVR